MFSTRTITRLIGMTALACLLLSTGSTARDHSSVITKTDSDETTQSGSSDSDLKAFDELVEDLVVIEGLFTFYQDTTDNSMLMAIKPEQIGPNFLCSESRSRGDGAFYDNSAMRRGYPFYFQRVGKRIMLLEKNLRVRVDSASNVHEALESGISDHLIAGVDVKSLPHDSTSAILVDPAELFVRDVGNVGYFLGSMGKTGMSFDGDNSYFEEVKSFPENTEITVRLHFKTNKPQYNPALQNGYSFFHAYHYSLFAIPESDYIPRLADDRLCYFTTIYQDYTELDRKTPYVRYIDRWNLKKKFPDSAVSEPVEPIVYWVDRAVPEEYRQAFADGIEFWNPAFEKIGFRNAIVAKQMPNDAEWDPADSRYNVVQWM
ncbi:MAG: hypothetical protein DRP45_10465, partial [Candidatus Zixiibacteriota bacterium]